MTVRGWWDGASCAGLPAVWWDTDWHPDRQRAITICYGCPVQDLCYDEAMEIESRERYSRWGIWGGTLPRERARIARGEQEPWTCAQGHRWTIFNTMWHKGYRACRTCHNERSHQRHLTASAASAPPPAAP